MISISISICLGMRVCLYDWYCPHILVNMNLCADNPVFRVPLFGIVMRDALHKKIAVTFVALSLTSHNHTKNSNTQTQCIE